MEKMCKVSDLEARYSYKSLAPWKNEIGGGVNKCLKVKDFLQYFEKTNYELSVPNRNEMRLFPLSDINESHIVLEPTLTFEYPSLSMKSTENSKINGFTYKNLEGPWTVTISNQSSPNHFSASVDSANNRVLVTSLFPGSSLVDETCTITLTGTRVDGQGTYSASFKVIQYAKVAMYNLRFWNQVSDYNNSIVFEISNGKDNSIQVIYGHHADIPIYVGDTLVISNLDKGHHDVTFKIKGSDNILLSGSGVIFNEASLPYSTISDNYPGKEGTTIDVYLIPARNI